MERKMSISLYVMSFVIAILMFILGVYIGNMIDDSNLDSLSGELSSMSGRLASLQLLLLTESNSSSFCPVYSSELNPLDDDIEKIGYKLSYLEDERQLYDPELKKQYFILEAESYLLSKKVNSLCNDSDNLLIHFYSNKNCGQICKDQGTAVLQARDQLAGESVTVKLFSFDGELDSPIAEALENEYHVTTYPTLVINGKTYSGFQSIDQIKNILRASE
ncbi:MAG: hypothetical protein ABID61_03725 [Candidatus Micrarchaeota archaeon]